MKEYTIIQGDATSIPLSDKSCDLVIGSPPYIDARLYLENGKNLGISRDCEAWIDFMLKVTAEACRVSRGMVIWVCAGVTRDRVYQPGPEGLLYRWWQQGGTCWRPCYWHRVGIPGSGHEEWFRADIEYCLAFTSAQVKTPMRKVVSVDEVQAKVGTRLRHTLECGHRLNRKEPCDALPCGKCNRVLEWSDNTACGHPPKWARGGEMSNRLPGGARRTQWGGVGSSSRKTNGQRDTTIRPSHRIVNQWGHSFATGEPAGEADDVTCAAPRPSHRIGRMSHMIEANGAEPKVAALLASGFPFGGKLHTKAEADGRMRVQAYLPPVLANPGNLLKVNVGGGLLGHKLAHENEAPYPVGVPEFFIKSLCRPGGVVLDPFGGSGTTADAAIRNGRRAIVIDMRKSQCDLAALRLATPVATRKQRSRKPDHTPTLFDAPVAA